MESTTDRWDVVVIGGGTAGLSAALVLGRARRRVAVIDAGQPRNAPAAHMHGFLSHDGMPPAALLSVGRAEVTAYGVQIVNDTVVEIATGGRSPSRALARRRSARYGLPGSDGFAGRSAVFNATS
jgi:thioredoxin reductase